MIKVVLYQLILVLGFAASAQIINDDSEPTRCGAQCRRKMGECTVNEDFWQGLLRSEYRDRAESCCRSASYVQKMRRCGYGPETGGPHNRGQAIDLGIDPKLCTKRNLKSPEGGFAGVDICPHVHKHPLHCHVNLCAAEKEVREARNNRRAQHRRVRRRNRGGRRYYNYDNYSVRGYR
jgi:hypothetical protein